MEEEIEDLRPLLKKIVATGVSQARVAREIGLTRATINIVLRKNDCWMPGYSAGKKLVAFAKRCGIDA